MSNANHELEQLIQPVIDIARQAGDAIMEFFVENAALQVELKADQTPLTAADLRSNTIITQGLQQLRPKIPMVSEESELPTLAQSSQWDRFWLVDPLDGTRGFMGHFDEFTVNIALIEQHRAVLGVVYAPAKKLLYYAHIGSEAFCETADRKPQPIKAAQVDWDYPRIIMGRYRNTKRIDAIFSRVGQHQLIKMNSSLKFCWVAQGSADIYPGVGMTSEWDTAAGQVVLEQAGGIVVDFNGQSLQYNAKSHWRNPPFLALGDRDALATCFLQMKRGL